MKTNPNLVLREIYGKSIIMPIRYNEASNDPIYLNEVAAVIYKSADESANAEELLRNICTMFALSDDSAESVAVQGFITQMIESNLILED